MKKLMNACINISFMAYASRYVLTELTPLINDSMNFINNLPVA